jgi:hypothetical protein
VNRKEQKDHQLPNNHPVILNLFQDLANGKIRPTTLFNISTSKFFIVLSLRGACMVSNEAIQKKFYRIDLLQALSTGKNIQYL